MRMHTYYSMITEKFRCLPIQPENLLRRLLMARRTLRLPPCLLRFSRHVVKPRNPFSLPRMISHQLSPHVRKRASIHPRVVGRCHPYGQLLSFHRHLLNRWQRVRSLLYLFKGFQAQCCHPCLVQRLPARPPTLLFYRHVLQPRKHHLRLQDQIFLLRHLQR